MALVDVDGSSLLANLQPKLVHLVLAVASYVSCVVGSQVEQTPHVEKTTAPVWNKVYEVNVFCVVPAIFKVNLIHCSALHQCACVFNVVLAVCQI